MSTTDVDDDTKSTCSDSCRSCLEEITFISDLAHEIAARMVKLEELIEMHKMSALLAAIPCQGGK